MQQTVNLESLSCVLTCMHGGSIVNFHQRTHFKIILTYKMISWPFLSSWMKIDNRTGMCVSRAHECDSKFTICQLSRKAFFCSVWRQHSYSCLVMVWGDSSLNLNYPRLKTCLTLIFCQVTLFCSTNCPWVSKQMMPWL